MSPPRRTRGCAIAGRDLRRLKRRRPRSLARWFARWSTSAALLAASLLLPAATARAGFTAAKLLSTVPPLQFEEASSPAFAQDGEYVAFRGTLAGVPGIYRRDLRTGTMELVAGASSETELDAPEAAAPSISAEGRYVTFTTAHDLDAADDTGSGCPEVYVRDMDAPLVPDKRVEEEDRLAAEQGRPQPTKPYVLASAASSTSRGLEYEQPCSPPRSPTQLVRGGAQAAPAVALSANGQEVAFTVLSQSDLTGPCTAAPVKCPTEPSQVAVRDLATGTTTLVSSTPEGGPTPGGGAFPSTASAKLSGAAGTEVESAEPTASSAAISADGNAVAWQGTNVPQQVPSAAQEVTAGMAGFGGPALEVEPLWRPLGGGGALTERLLAGAGLNFYFGESHENSEPIEGGALAPAKQVFAPPVLSADGSVAAVTSDAPTAANEGSYQFIGFKAVPPADGYLVHIGSSQSSSPQVTPLTATPDFASLNAIYDGVTDMAISPDGTRVAFDTKRVSFALAPPTLISPPAQETDYTYTYEANIALGTLQRVTSTYDGASPDGDAGPVSFAGSGLALALASSAGNLVYGDVTPGISQVYLLEEQPSEEQPTPQSASPTPTIALPAAEWTLSATATAQRNGSVLVYAEVPGAGRLEVRATAQLPASPSTAARARKAKRRARAASDPAPRASTVRADATRSPARIVTPTIAHAAMVTAGPSGIQLRLHASAAYSAQVSGKDGLYTVLSIGFAAPGHATLTRRIAITLHRVAPEKRSARSKAAHHRVTAGKGRAEAVARGEQGAAR